jgi:hypothetical protein
MLLDLEGQPFGFRFGFKILKSLQMLEISELELTSKELTIFFFAETHLFALASCRP